MPISVQPEGHARPGGHYSHGTVANGLVFVSGVDRVENWPEFDRIYSQWGRPVPCTTD